MYKIIFFNQNKVYEIYANQVSSGSIFGFIEISGFLFADQNQLLVDVAEEKLRSEFMGVQSSLIPLQAVIRIDQVQERGAVRISEAGQPGNIMAFPGSPLPRS